MIIHDVLITMRVKLKLDDLNGHNAEKQAERLAGNAAQDWMGSVPNIEDADVVAVSEIGYKEAPPEQITDLRPMMDFLNCVGDLSECVELPQSSVGVEVHRAGGFSVIYSDLSYPRFMPVGGRMEIGYREVEV